MEPGQGPGLPFVAQINLFTMQYYTVLGNPINHSLSPVIHKLFAEQSGQLLCYTATLVSLTGLRVIIQNLKTTHHGLNITAPFKQQAYALCDNVSLRAEKAKSVNTIIFADDQSIIGDNTDGIGLLRDLKNNLGYAVANKSILILGTGGAARGIISELQAEGPKSLHVIGRTQQNTDKFAAEFTLSPLTLRDTPFDLIINTTPATNNSIISELPGRFVATSTFCYDLSYTHSTSDFFEWGKQQRAGYIQNGLGMLVEQAAESFYIWRNVRPETAPILRKLRQG